MGSALFQPCWSLFRHGDAKLSRKTVKLEKTGDELDERNLGRMHSCFKYPVNVIFGPPSLES
jgi:hypothetical protein